MKIRRVRAELSHTDRQTDRQTEGRTDMTKLILAFSKFCESARNRTKRNTTGNARIT